MAQASVEPEEVEGEEGEEEESEGEGEDLGLDDSISPGQDAAGADTCCAKVLRWGIL